MEEARLRTKQQQYNHRFEELNVVIKDAQNEQQQLRGAYQLAEEIIKELDSGAQSRKAKDGPSPKPV